MNAVSIISVVFGGVSLVASIVIAVRNYTRDSREDTEAEMKERGAMKDVLTELKIITKDINLNVADMKAEIKGLVKNLSEMDTRLVLVEREQKNIWSKIDELRSEINGKK